MFGTPQYFILGLLLTGLVSPVPGQESAIYRPLDGQNANLETREALGLSFPEGKTIKVLLKGTSRLPVANGMAEVKRNKGATMIDIRLDHLKPAYLFGGDYSTYVLWTVSPQGQARNAGEVIQDGDDSRMKVTTPLDTFGMFVSAEPHFLVSSPSRFVVLETVQPEKQVSGALIHVSRINYRGYSGVYRFDRQSLSDLGYIKGEVRPEIREAQAAINVAMLAGAERFAPAELKRAQDEMARLTLAQNSRAETGSVTTLAHEVIRLAVDAQQAAERVSQASLPEQRMMQGNARVLPRAEMPAQTIPEVNPAARDNAGWSRLNDALRGVAPTRNDSQYITIDLPPSIFEAGGSTLAPSGRETLSRIASILIGSTGYSKVRIEGYGANAVAEYFIQSGLPPNIVVFRQVGESGGPLEIVVE